MKNNQEGEYRDFADVFCGVRDGSMPFEALLEHQTYVRRGHQICAFFAPRQQGEDVFQELSIRVFTKIDTLYWVTSETQFFAWATTVAHNVSSDMFRKNRGLGGKDELPVEEHIICDTTTPSPYLERAIQEWTASLPPLRKRIVELYSENPGISTRKISELLEAEGIKRCHTMVAAELREALKSCLQVLEKIGKSKRAREKRPRKRRPEPKGESGHEKRQQQQQGGAL